MYSELQQTPLDNPGSSHSWLWLWIPEYQIVGSISHSLQWSKLISLANPLSSSLNAFMIINGFGEISFLRLDGWSPGHARVTFILAIYIFFLNCLYNSYVCCYCMCLNVRKLWFFCYNLGVISIVISGDVALVVAADDEDTLVWRAVPLIKCYHHAFFHFKLSVDAPPPPFVVVKLSSVVGPQLASV